jgi:hypothetical protein
VVSYQQTKPKIENQKKLTAHRASHKCVAQRMSANLVRPLTGQSVIPSWQRKYKRANMGHGQVKACVAFETPRVDLPHGPQSIATRLNAKMRPGQHIAVFSQLRHARHPHPPSRPKLLRQNTLFQTVAKVEHKKEFVLGCLRDLNARNGANFRIIGHRADRAALGIEHFD